MVKTKDEEEVDLLLAKSQKDLDALMEKTAGTIDLLLDHTSEKMDEYLLDKPADRKKSKKHKESNEATEEFGGKIERKKSKKHKDKEIEELGEEEGHTADGEKKKKKRKKGGKSTATSCATSRGASPTPSSAPTEVNGSEELHKWGGSSEPISYEMMYRVPKVDRFKQITRDVHNLDTSIHNLYEKEKLYKIRMLQQKYWHKPENRLYHSNLEFQEKPYNKMVEMQRPVSDVNDKTLALAASMTRMAASRLEETRFEREREDKLIHMNINLMDSLQSLGRRVQNLAVDHAPVRVNQYHAMPNVGIGY